MAKKKTAKKVVKKRPAQQKATTKQVTAKKAAPKATAKGAAKTTAKAAPKTAAKAAPKTTAKAKAAPAARNAAPAKVAKKVAVKKAPAAPVKKKKKKGVRRATMTTGVRNPTGKSMGRSRIPIDAPLSVVFQNVLDAQEAFALLGIHTVRELELFDPDELVMRLTSPAKQTVGRIRKILAMNNRCLLNDESFALEYKERLEETQKLPR